MTQPAVKQLRLCLSPWSTLAGSATEMLSVLFLFDSTTWCILCGYPMCVYFIYCCNSADVCCDQWISSLDALVPTCYVTGTYLKCLLADSRGQHQLCLPVLQTSRWGSPSRSTSRRWRMRRADTRGSMARSLAASPPAISTQSAPKKVSGRLGLDQWRSSLRCAVIIGGFDALWDCHY